MKKISKRNSKRIRIWMLEKGYTVESFRAELGYTNHTPVSLVINGSRDTERVLQYLTDKGCPVRYLDFPKTTKDAKS